MKAKLTKEELLSYPVTDILEKAGLRLRSKGKTMVTSCPFHVEKTPSFTVFLKTNSCYCFGCGKGWDAWQLVQRLNKVDAADAARIIEGYFKDIPASEREILIKDIKAKQGKAENELSALPSEKEQEVYEKFFKRLEFVKPGDEAHDYLVKDRKLSPEIIKKMNLRWVKDTRFLRHLAKEHREVFYQRGLVKFLQPGTIVFPFTQEGKIIYLQGREIHPSNPKRKYINLSGGVPSLFAVDEIKDNKVVFLAEGMPDCLALWSNGYPAVGMVSTILKDEWLPKLKNKTVIIAIDDDGRFEDDEDMKSMRTPVYKRKVQKLIRTLKKGESIKPAVVHLPINWDINDFFQKYPGYKFETYSKAVKDLADQKPSAEVEMSLI
jgi:DNA primase